MYSYCKKIPLPNLQATGQNSLLEFKTPAEQAKVYLSDSGIIKEVIYTNLVTGEKKAISASDATEITVGSGNCQRQVLHFLLPSSLPSMQLRLGLTTHTGIGTWSSLPHGFEHNLEPDFEEVFFYVLSGATEKAIQVGKGVWADGTSVDAIWPVENQTFSTIPMGYHPVVGEPGVKVSYVWAYLAKKKEWEKVTV
ncbi:MAG: 5-deoxy-glucuronate isomerase [Myxococcota bacterium]